MDADGGGAVLFEEFANFVIKNTLKEDAHRGRCDDAFRMPCDAKMVTEKNKPLKNNRAKSMDRLDALNKESKELFKQKVSNIDGVDKQTLVNMTAVKRGGGLAQSEMCAIANKLPVQKNPAAKKQREQLWKGFDCNGNG